MSPVHIAVVIRSHLLLLPRSEAEDQPPADINRVWNRSTADFLMGRHMVRQTHRLASLASSMPYHMPTYPERERVAVGTLVRVLLDDGGAVSE